MNLRGGGGGGHKWRDDVGYINSEILEKLCLNKKLIDGLFKIQPNCDLLQKSTLKDEYISSLILLIFLPS